MEKKYQNEFIFNRSRGIVWVCDVQDSTKLLNDDRTVDNLEQFFPRLYWVGKQVVESANGLFTKWTGDGFLAWFEAPLHRELGRKAALVFNAAWQLTYLVNLTQLGVSTDQIISIRHGITFENDALKMMIRNQDGSSTIDLIGRDIVLAFRLSSISVDFPRIVTQRSLVDCSARYLSKAIHFEKLLLNDDDVLRFFKGERISLNTLYASSQRRKTRTKKSLSKQVSEALKKAEYVESTDDVSFEFTREYIKRLYQGPKWAKAIADKVTRFTREEIYDNLKILMPIIESLNIKRS